MQQQDQDIDQILDQFNFQAITDGLGFHHSVGDKKEVEKSLIEKANDLDRSLNQHIEQLRSEDTKKIINHGELAPFYEAVEPEPIEELSDFIDAASDKTFTRVTFSQRLVAFLVDCALVFMMTVLTLVMSFWMIDLVLSDILVFPLEVMTLFLSFFFLYFCILDATSHSTLGKRMMGFSLLQDGKKLSLAVSAGRTIYCIFSFILLGLPIVLKTHDNFFRIELTHK